MFQLETIGRELASRSLEERTAGYLYLQNLGQRAIGEEADKEKAGTYQEIMNCYGANVLKDEDLDKLSRIA